MNYLNEEFVALEVTEPGDPSRARLLTVIIIPSASRIVVVLRLLRTIHLQSIINKLLHLDTHLLCPSKGVCEEGDGG